jgi:hypothetical protein
MCILSYLPPTVPVDVDGLLNGAINNPDGHGWAVTTGSTMLIGKSLSAEEALDTFITAREAHPEGHALFHSRWATHGGINTDNVHPFYVGGSQTTVVAHNGILPSKAHPSKGDPRSDTRKFADEILPRQYRRLNRKGVRHALSQWIGAGNKLVILTVDDRYKRNAFIINEQRGNWDATGIWHSNYDYLDARSWGQASYTTGTLGYTSTWVPSLKPAGSCKPSLWEPCDICGMGEVNSRGYCDKCSTCADCYEVERDCLCFVRAALERDSADEVDQEWFDGLREPTAEEFADLAEREGRTAPKRYWWQDDDDGARAAWDVAEGNLGTPRRWLDNL